MLSDFFRINYPYGIAKNNQGGWMAFNREYLPIGFSSGTSFDINTTSHYPIHTKYKGLTETSLMKLAGDENSVRRDENDKIITVFLYDDKTNPVNQSKDNIEYWNRYFNKLKILATIKI